MNSISILLTFFSGVVIALLGVVMKNFTKEVVEVKQENKKIKENYVDKFDKVNLKLDDLKEAIYELDKKIDLHITRTEGNIK